MHRAVALWMLLVLPVAAAVCSSEFTSKLANLQTLQTPQTAKQITFNTQNGPTVINGYSIKTSLSSLSPVDLVGMGDVGCDPDSKTAYGFKFSMLAGDMIMLYVLPSSGGKYQLRQSNVNSVCPGETLHFIGGAAQSRCHVENTVYSVGSSSGKSDTMVFLQPAATPMELFWHYIPDPTRQVDSCALSKNGNCDENSGLCHIGTDCTDCNGTDCQASKCFAEFPPYRVADEIIPRTCDDPKWKALSPALANQFGSTGPWDCKALEREMRWDCHGCLCTIKDACTDSLKDECQTKNRESCQRGSDKCGSCLKGYLETGGQCNASPCDVAAKEVCQRANKKSCTGESFECGDCLQGFGKVSSICVDISQCKISDIPSKMVLLLDTSGSLDNPLSGGKYGNFDELKSFARDLVGVFPINEFAIRAFSTKITPYPASGEFVGKAKALTTIPSMRYDNSQTFTGEALKHTFELLENERDSFNIVIIFTDGKATDGGCKTSQETCNPTTALCERNDGGTPSGQRCTMQIQAPKLMALPDRNSTVTVVSVGFGNVNADELKFIASGTGDANTIIAQGKDASAGLAALELLLGKLVDKVCTTLPVDCVIKYQQWSPCDWTCGQQFQTRKIDAVTEPRNGGRPCPSSKGMNKKYRQACPVKPDCPSTTTTTPMVTDVNGDPVTAGTGAIPKTDVTDANGDPVTAGTGAIPKTDGNGNPVTTASTVVTDGNPVTAATTIVTDANGKPVTAATGTTTTRNTDDMKEVDEGVVNMVFWALVTACYATILLV